MDVKTTQVITNNVYSVRFDLTFTDADNLLLNKYGDPEVNYGGAIYTIGMSPSLLFTLPNNFRGLRAGTGWTQLFDGNVDSQAETKAIAYAAGINTSLATAMTTVRENSDTYSTVKTTTT
jgi:hypothetical protein